METRPDDAASPRRGCRRLACESKSKRWFWLASWRQAGDSAIVIVDDKLIRLFCFCSSKRKMDKKEKDAEIRSYMGSFSRPSHNLAALREGGYVYHGEIKHSVCLPTRITGDFGSQHTETEAREVFGLCVSGIRVVSKLSSVCVFAK